MKIILYVVIAVFSALLVADAVYIKKAQVLHDADKALPQGMSQGASSDAGAQAPRYDAADMLSVLEEVQRLYGRGQYGKALLVIKAGSPQFETETVFLVARADVLLALDQHELAFKDAQTILQRDGVHVRALEIRARYFQAQDQVQRAQADVTAIFALDPENGDALLVQGLIHFSREKYQLAIETLTAALGQYHDSLPVLYNRAQCHIALEQYRAARADLLIVAAEAKGTPMGTAAEEALATLATLVPGQEK